MNHAPKLLVAPLAALLAVGCAHTPPPSSTDSALGRDAAEETTYAPVVETTVPASAPEPVTHVRYARYTLVSTQARPDQYDLLAQIIDARVPTTPTLKHPSVKDALDYVTLRTGYALCPASTSPEVATLYNRPLPAAHHELGPMALREALRVLAGPAFQVESDDLYRLICFRLHPNYQPVHVATTPALGAVVSAGAPVDVELLAGGEQ